ncbi:HD-GYP domain-containing protein [Crassaminicella profunda]|uniref:HD-GYP domain-containing protein n=1 Tax=Crassaminicella profunda TaxID=1286698 RepID=UPI001CA763EB|nr:HD-GYP domain-containing protein [Crassaminicella profunda]QZY56357.1 HD-GYP domain-containing protein [Crassaminicella profunda]
MKVINVQDLKEGMILAQDIIGKSDLLFLTRGTKLIDEHIQRIQNMDIIYVYIGEQDEIKGQKSLSKFSIKIDKKLNEQYNKSLVSFKTVYEEVSLGKKLESEIIQESVSPLIEEVMTDNNILARLRSMEIVDDYTYKHSINVCILSTMIGKWLNYSEDDLNKLAIAGMLHDIGKSRIPKEILNKPGKLSINECQIMKGHATLGYEMLQEQDEISFDICCGALQHHERMDGKGYPLGVKGEKIHEFARIIAVADIFDAMTSERVYKNKESPFKVAELIAQDRFGALDPYITNQFLWNISKFYVGNIVKLNTGDIGEIVLINKQMPTRPLVKIGNEFIDLNKHPQYEILEVMG